jgi:imidazolonepropionase-like amidohydrolase
MRKLSLRSLAAFILLIALCVQMLPTATAQRSSGSIAITNARIVTVSGATIDKGTLVIRNGLISEVGANVTAPADARVIDGSGLSIYPGLIDASTNLGIPQRQQTQGGPGGGQQQQQQQQQSTSSASTNYPVGLQPDTSAADLIRAGNEQFEQQRNAGITTALTAPRDGIFMGQSAVINLAGDTATQMILRPAVGQHITFRTLQTGGYPNSLLGTFSAIRQMLLDAKRLKDANELYQQNPKGLQRPEQDKSLLALIPVVEGRMPVVMNANSEREIVRALDLADEFKLKVIIAGGVESGNVAARLKKMDVPVLLSINFPKRTTASVPEADPEPLRVLRARVEAPKTAGKLAAAGVRFAFQSGNMTSINDFIANATKTTENGLSKDAALRAMTLSAAEIFGMADRTGSIEVGKIANLTITRGDIFAKDTRVTHVFIDGVMFENKTPAAPPTRTGGTPSSAVPNIAGTWTLNIDIPGNPITVTAVLTQQGEKLSGTLQTPFGNSEISSGSISADGFTFKTTVNAGQPIEVTFTGKVTGNQMSGVVNSPQGDAPFTGTKNP